MPHPLGQTLRQRRQSLGLTLQHVADAVGCARSYLSGIETGKVANPPSRPLLDALETALNITPGELRRLADWHRTPPAVKHALHQLAARLAADPDRRGDGAIDLDRLYQRGELHRAAEAVAANLDPLNQPCVQVPLINRVAAGLPSDFTDLDYPARVADRYVHCPDLSDPHAFAARVVGSSMEPLYREGDIVVFSPALDPADGSDCFIRLLPDHQTTFKRVFFEANDHFRLQPLNDRFPPRTVHRDAVAGLYPAVMRLQYLHPSILAPRDPDGP